MSWTQEMKDLANSLWDVGAFLDKTKSEGGRGFKLKLHQKEPDAPLSPFYLNLRMSPKGPLTKVIMDTAGQQLFGMVKSLQYVCVAGLPKAGDPLAESFLQAALAGGQDVRLIGLHKEEAGDKRQITKITSGEYQLGERVLVVDDLITRADTKLEGVKVLADEGLVVRDVVVIVDRQQGGAQQLAEAGYSLHALFPLDKLLEHYVGERQMPSLLQNEIMEYVRAA